MALSVVFAEDNYLLREGTAALLAETEGVTLAASVGDLPGLIAAVDEHRPDAVLTDIRMPPGNAREGIDAAHTIRNQHPGTGVLVLSQHSDDEYAHALLEHGAEGLGYLLKERVSDIDEVVAALHEVARGGTVLDPKIVTALVSRRQRAERSLLSRLTVRETEVLQHMAQGKTNAAIAETIFLSKRAVEKLITTIFQKLDLNEEPAVDRRVMAVLTFLREEGMQAGT